VADRLRGRAAELGDEPPVVQLCPLSNDSGAAVRRLREAARVRFAMRSLCVASFLKRRSWSNQRCFSKKRITEVLFCIAAT
jgi:hypothetical protein